MRFQHPQALFLLIVLPALGFLHFWAQARRRQALELLVGADLAGKLVPGLSPMRRHLKFMLQLGAVTFLILAVARPKFGTRLEEVHRKGLDLIVGLDVSRSMLAEDVKPNRLARAKAAVGSLIDRLQGDQVGLVAFAGTAHLQCPLTVDYAAAKMMLEAVETDLIPVGGTNLSDCIRTAIAAFPAREAKYKVMILVTDGEDTAGDVKPALEEAKKAGVKIYTIGLGRSDGEIIPIRSAAGVEYVKDRQENVVKSRLDVATLTRVATATGGVFYQSTRGETELDDILTGIQGLERRELNSRTLEHYEDRFQLFVLLALVCLLVDGAINERARAPKEWSGRFA